MESWVWRVGCGELGVWFDGEGWVRVDLKKAKKIDVEKKPNLCVWDEPKPRVKTRKNPSTPRI